MEHEVFVPVVAQRLKEALADPARIARAVPGLQQDAGAEPVSGRLKVRVGSHSVTYRGTVRVTPREDGSYAAEGDVAETRGTGSVKLALTLRVEEAEGGSRLVFGGTATADGRVTELPPEQVASAATRLLNRFAENLGTLATAEPEAEESGSAEAKDSGTAETEDSGTAEESGAADAAEPLVTQDFEPKATSDFETTPDADDAPAPGLDSPDVPDSPEHSSVFETEVPPPSLDPLSEEQGPAPGGFTEAPVPPAEAAHARRTMIGRSAEEVDHAPPRGRYAPVPAPQTVSGGSALRWAAPAAALVLASAIVVGRALRKRR